MQLSKRNISSIRDSILAEISNDITKKKEEGAHPLRKVERG